MDDAGILRRLEELGLELPSPPVPVASYVPVTQAGAIAFVAGQVAMVDGQLLHPGKLGRQVSIEKGQEAAARAAVQSLSALRAHLVASRAFGALIGPMLVTRRWSADTVKQAVADPGVVRLSAVPPDEANPHAAALTDALRAAGWRPPAVAEDAGFVTGQPRFNFWLPVAGRSDDELLAGMNQLWRRNIRKAAKEGSPIAQNRLAWVLVNGNGVPMDKIEGLKWHMIAKTSGRGDPQMDADLAELSPEDRAKVEAAAAKWLGGTSKGLGLTQAQSQGTQSKSSSAKP